MKPGPDGTRPGKNLGTEPVDCKGHASRGRVSGTSALAFREAVEYIPLDERDRNRNRPRSGRNGA